MDKRIFRYVALTPTGSATREDLIATFWPEETGLASQLRLRTACTNIRKAIAAVVPPEEVGHYFSAGPDTVAVNLTAMNVDVRRYIAHMRYGNASHAADDFGVAAEHYGQALAIYSGDIGWGYDLEEWLRPLAKACAQLHRDAIERLAQIARANGATSTAVEYESQLEDLYPMEAPR